MLLHGRKPAPLHCLPTRARVLALAQQELLLFPTYILSIHELWSQLGWTKFAVAAAVILLDLLSGIGYTLRGSERPLVPSIVSHTTDLRSWLLQCALWAFLASAGEILLHVTIASIETELSGSFFIAVFLIVGIGQLGWVALTAAIWRAKLRGTGCRASAYWTPVQFLAGMGALFSFGAGFYVGPVLLCSDALVRAIYAIEMSSAELTEKEDEIALSSAQTRQDV